MASITLAPDVAKAMVGLTLSFPASVGAVKVERIDAAGSRTTIRAGESFALNGGSGQIQDYEVPLDTAVTYEATQPSPGTEKATSVAVTIVSYGYTWLRDPGTPSRNLRLDEVTSLETVTREAQAGVFDIIDRKHPIVVAARRHGWEGDLVCVTATSAQRKAMVDLLSRGQILLLSTPAGYDLGNVYVHVGSVSEKRIGVVTEPTREWTLPLVMVDRPSQLATAVTYMRWIDVETSWPTWNDLYNTGLTWDELLVYPVP